MSNLSLLEQKTNQIFRLLSITLFTFYYPNLYIAVIEAQDFEEKAYLLERFSDQNKEVVISVGKTSDIYQISDSYASALIAAENAAGTDDHFILFDNLTLEIIFSSLKEREKKEYLSKMWIKSPLF